MKLLTNVPADSLGIKAAGLQETIRRVKKGLPFKVVKEFQRKSGLSLEAIARVLRIPPRTLARRKLQKALTPEESDRLVRLSQIFDQAVELFDGDAAKAAAWLTTPCRALEKETPLTLAETETGSGEVERILGRLEHGVFS